MPAEVCIFFSDIHVMERNIHSWKNSQSVRPWHASDTGQPGSSLKRYAKVTGLQDTAEPADLTGMRA